MERRLGSAEKHNAGEPSVPTPAASVVLLRPVASGSAGIKVLLLKRTESASFMPGVWVFPGGAVDPCDGVAEGSYRACAVRELGEEAEIELDDSHELILFSRWITPAVVTRRFDARFFLAMAPPGAMARPDGTETTEAGWFEPAVAVAAAEGGSMPLTFPTLTQLRSLLPFATVEAALAGFRDRAVEPILPVVIADGDGHRVALPGDPDYPA